MAILIIIVLSSCTSPDPASSSKMVSELGLSEYRQVAGPMVLEGIDNNASGLTWDWDTDTLIVIVNGPAILVRVAATGRTLERAEVPFGDDFEGVTYLGDGRLAMIEERRARLNLVRWVGSELTLERQIAIPDVPLLARANRGPEGIAFNRQDGSLRIVSEQWPRRYWVAALGVHDLTISSTECIGGESLDDWAGLSAVPGSTNFLLMSEQSKRILELDQDCQEVAALDLELAGLVDVPQPEGLIVDSSGRLFIVSEPNLLYLLERSNTGM